jgi:hypothetical protein
MTGSAVDANHNSLESSDMEHEEIDARIKEIRNGNFEPCPSSEITKHEVEV